MVKNKEKWILSRQITTICLLAMPKLPQSSKKSYSSGNFFFFTQVQLSMKHFITAAKSFLSKTHSYSNGWLLKMFPLLKCLWDSLSYYKSTSTLHTKVVFLLWTDIKAFAFFSLLFSFQQRQKKKKKHLKQKDKMFMC